METLIYLCGMLILSGFVFWEIDRIEQNEKALKMQILRLNGRCDNLNNKIAQITEIMRQVEDDDKKIQKVLQIWLKEDAQAEAVKQ